MNKSKGIRKISILLAILVLAMLSCQGAGGFNPFATPTPTPTATFTPTATPTITPSPTPSRTPTSTPLSGIIVDEQSDGTSLVIDHDNNYQLVLPKGWFVLFSSEEDMKQAIESAGKRDPDLAKMVENYKDADPEIFRLAALNADHDFRNTGFPTIMTVSAYEGQIASMPMAFVTAMIEDTILENAKSTTWDVVTNSNKVEVGTVRGTKAINIPNKFQGTIEILVITFQAKGKLVVIEVAAPQKVAEEIFAALDDLVDSIELNR
jgi:hypothetical protein